MAQHEPGSAIEPREDDGIDPALARMLVEAIVSYPTFATACAACGVTTRSVESMLQRGVQAGAPRSLRAFAKAFAKADADNARDHWELAGTLLRQGQVAAAKAVSEMVAKRWRLDQTPDVMAILTAGKRSVELRSRLEAPPPVLAAMIADMLRAPNQVWAGLIERAGLVRAAPEADSGDAEEGELEQEGDGAQEQDEDGSGA